MSSQQNSIRIQKRCAKPSKTVVQQLNSRKVVCFLLWSDPWCIIIEQKLFYSRILSENINLLSSQDKKAEIIINLIEEQQELFI